MSAIAADTVITDGIRTGVPYEEYAAMPGVRISSLKALKVSPLHYRHRLTCPQRSKPLALGQAAHMAVLEPERFRDHYAVWDRVSDSGNACPRRGQHWDKWLADNAGKEAITVADYNAAVQMAYEVRRSKVAMKYLAEGAPEVSMVWHAEAMAPGAHEPVPMRCKARLDFVNNVRAPTIVEVKTAADVREILFGNACARLGYHMQLAYQYDGFLALTGKVPKMIVMAIESKPPFDVVPYTVSEDVIDQGRIDYQQLLDKLLDCEMTGAWHGVAEDGEKELTLPTWLYGTQSEDISDLGLEA